MSDTPILYDWAGKPTPASGQTQAFITNRQAGALYGPQGGMVQLGSDYASSAAAQIPKVDATGSQYVVPANPAGGAAQVYTGQSSPAQSAQYGNLCFARQDYPTPSDYQPLLVDNFGALLTTGSPKPTFRAVLTGVACAANKVLVSVMNGSSKILRMSVVHIYVPPQSSSGALLGQSSTTYYPLFCEMWRTGALAKGTGTTVTPFPSDSADLLDSTVPVYSNNTLPTSTGTVHRRDALVSTNTGVPWYKAECSLEKNLTFRPGEGAAIVCISNGQIASGSSTVTANVDVLAVFTLAPA